MADTLVPHFHQPPGHLSGLAGAVPGRQQLHSAQLRNQFVFPAKLDCNHSVAAEHQAPPFIFPSPGGASEILILHFPSLITLSNEDRNH